MARPALVWMASAALLLAVAEARAQDFKPPIAVEGTVGWSAFVDDDAIEHTVVGGAVRFPVTPRLSVGPEVMYMAGPGSDRDTFVVGSVWFDWFRPRPGFRVVPYFVAGGGLMRQTSEYRFGETSSSNDGALTGGGGVRVHFNDRVYAGVDARIGWEPHLRLAGHVGVQLR